MKNFQVRLPDPMHADLKAEADRCQVSLADLIREAVELRQTLRALLAGGGRLLHEQGNKERVALIIPGLTRGNKK